MLKQIDQACNSAGIQPDLHLSGHAHLYERYTRTVAGKQIPYVAAGMGGFYNLPGLKAVNKRPAPPKFPASGTDASGNPLSLRMYNNNTFGFLRMTVSPTAITGEFITVDPATGATGTGDSFTLDLTTNTIADGVAAAGGRATGATGHAPSKSKTKTATKKSASKKK
jgi:hypothetical protein